MLSKLLGPSHTFNTVNFVKWGLWNFGVHAIIIGFLGVSSVTPFVLLAALAFLLACAIEEKK